MSAIAASGVAVTPSAPAGTKESLMIGHPDNNNKTFIDVFNVAVWEKYYYSSNAYELTGHTGKMLVVFSFCDVTNLLYHHQNSEYTASALVKTSLSPYHDYYLRLSFIQMK